MKSEFRKSKSERIPKSKIRSVAFYRSSLLLVDAFAGFLGVPRVGPTYQSIDAGFGLRVSFGIRISDFGFVRSLVSTKPARIPEQGVKN